MIVTSDSTALGAISSDAKIGRSTETKRGTSGERRRAARPEHPAEHDEDQHRDRRPCR